ALLRDLTLVVAAEREAAAHLARIHEIEEQHRTLLDNAPLVIFRLDPRTTELVYLNAHAERIFGVPISVALATPGFLRDAHEGEGAAAFASAVARAQARKGSFTYEARLTRKVGDAITARGTVYPLLTEGGEVAAIEGVVADVSAEQTARRRLVQTDRLATLGTLAAGVAHEINNPAAFILLGLDMLDRVLAGGGVTLDEHARQASNELVSEMRASIGRIVDIVRDLRMFAAPPAPTGTRRTLVDVVRTVDSALSLTRGQILERAELVRDLVDVPPVLMDDGRLAQVIVNLLVNATHAVRQATASERGERSAAISVATSSDGHTVSIAVTDTGVGVPEQDQARVWQPFFTTKPPDVGAGLGLSISRDIVERAGGSVSIESPVRHADGTLRGSRFVVTLPAAGPADPHTPTSVPLPCVPRARARVLVVEDEAPLAKALAEELGRTHDVVWVDSAERALDVIEQERAFDVVLCDLRMPGMGGRGLYTALVARDPAMCDAFVFMTGAGFGGDLEAFLATAQRPVLEKPFQARTAEDVIARVVTRRARR
ncbi:MAG TPA: ATP-binding protein, partial [Byssovorax sp.]